MSPATIIAMAPHRKMKKLLVVILLFATTLVSHAEDYPSMPLTIVVAYGVGGSADRMTRAMSPYISAELGQPVQVINISGAATLLGSNYLLSRPHDGYTLLASGFAPYLVNTILEGSATYSIEDFAYLNFQWFDEDLYSLSKRSKYKSMPELLEAIRTTPGKVKVAAVRGSPGHLMAKLLLEVNDIPPENMNLVAYNSGGPARAAVAGGVVDLLVISANGCEGIREYITPVAIGSDIPSETWKVPTLNQVLEPMGAKAPLLPGTIRGFATSAEFKSNHPERFTILANAIERALKNPELQKQLQQLAIGGRWVGPEKSTETMHTTFEIFRDYSYLLEIN
jgi:putative tricarboxylic transport membrane protein